jgi:hypothetical protein
MIDESVRYKVNPAADEPTIAQLTGPVFLWLLQRIERMSREDFASAANDHYGEKRWTFRIGDEDVADLLAVMASAKSCDYQLIEDKGSDMYCRVTESLSTPSKLITEAVTRHQCVRCTMPDRKIKCINLHHPTVQQPVNGRLPILVRAACDEGRPEIAAAAQCQPGGNSCWVAEVSTAEGEDSDADPRGLPEALDFLDATWRLAFGKKRHLVRLRRAEDISILASPCSSRAEFKAGISALDDVFKLFMIDDDLLTATDLADPNIKGDKTLNRLTACLRARLSEDVIGDALEAIKILRRVNEVRVALQHSGAGGKLAPALSALGVRQAEDWPEAWNAVRRRAITALTLLRKALRELET